MVSMLVADYGSNSESESDDGELRTEDDSTVICNETKEEGCEKNKTVG